MVRKFAILVVLLGLGACSVNAGLSSEQQAIKANCVAGDFNACSDLGHQMAAARG